MIDTKSQISAVSYYGATPITREELMNDFEPVIDRCESGETFVIMQDGEAVIYMVPYSEYRGMEERAAAPIRALESPDKPQD